jgi:ornithine cyclodeaminase
MTIAFYDAPRVEALLDYAGCIAVMREAMAALSTSGKPQPLRQVVEIGPQQLFGVMPGDLSAPATFGAKLVSVFRDPDSPGRSRHRGVIVAYDSATGGVQCIADAEPVTRIRTGCASAAATDALARADARVLAVYGAGTQAESHIRAISLVRPLDEVILWARAPGRAGGLAARLSAELGLAITPTGDGRAAAEAADIICTTTAAAEPVLLREWVRDGTHINLVGSSYLGPVEVDVPLVAAGRLFADYRPSVLAQGAEVALAREAGAIDDSHVVGEIGEVFAGTLAGRENAAQITIYKSLGHVVQDLASTNYLHERALRQGS